MCAELDGDKDPKPSTPSNPAKSALPKPGWYHVAGVATSDTLSGRASASVGSRIIHRRKNGFNVYAAKFIHKDGVTWAVTNYGTHYSALYLKAGKAPENKAVTPPVTAVLSRSSKGTRVRSLQEGLNKAFPDYRHDVSVNRGRLLVVDEYYGPATEAWVSLFQRHSGLPVTGVVNNSTAAALRTHGINI